MSTADIAPALWAKMRGSYLAAVSGDTELRAINAIARSGKATHLETQRLAARLAEITSESLTRSIFPDTLPNGCFYYNIGQRTVIPLIGMSHDLTMSTASLIQAVLNKNTGIGLKAVTPPLNSGVVNGILNQLTNAGDDYTKILSILGEPVRNTIAHFGNDFVKANADFQRRAGLQPQIERQAHGSKTCAWCRGLVWSGDYGDEPADFYRKHDYCRCTVLFTPSKDGNVKQNAHSKKWV
ncbi:MAG: hypothetical protein LBS85_00025 [Clostridiales Family XIII bacterium]|jgi:hypothetical protein|nr:hypothetical protein [Clostridiales Family XIII bacterium]